MRLCRCQRCSCSQALDPVTGRLYSGQYISESTFKEHRSLENAILNAKAHFDAPGPLCSPYDNLGSLHATGHTTETLSPDRYQTPSAASSPEGEIVMARLKTIDSKLKGRDFASTVGNTSLVFRRVPMRSSPPMVIPCPERLEVDNNASANAHVVHLERWLSSAEEVIEICQTTTTDETCIEFSSTLRARILHEQEVILQSKLLQWEKLRRSLTSLPRQIKIVDTARHSAQPLAYVAPDVVLVYLLVAFMHFIAGVSLKYCKCLLAGLQLQRSLNRNHGSAFKHFVSDPDLPSDVESLMARLPLAPTTVAYACCPRCFALYAYSPHKSHSLPEKCSSKRTASSDVCGTSLLDNTPRASAKRTGKPVRLFLYHELEDWVSRLYTRPHIESLLDRDVLQQDGGGGKDMGDILESPSLRGFLGPEQDPQRPFLKRPGNEGRLVFSLNMDSFNPLMNKESGKKISVGAIYMVCLTLPPAVRYEIENVFVVGIIPGPHEPSTDEINHILEPMVDDLLRLWHYGFYLTTTSRHPHGRLVRGAVIPLICDLPAVRQMSGFAGHQSRHFCSACTLPAVDIDNFDFISWPRRSQQEHRHLAEEWRNAPSEARREQLFQESGIRWSQLLRLPYWDPTRYVMIDSMHAFFLRLFQRHCRQIWGMGIDIEDSDYPSFKRDKDRPSYEEMNAGFQALRFGKEKRLHDLTTKVLRELARCTKILPFGGKSKKLVKELLQYRVRRGWFDEEDCCRRTFTAAEETGFAQEFLPPEGPTSGTSQKQGKRKRDEPPTTREIENALNILESGPKSSLRKTRKDVLMKLCELKSLPYKDKAVVADLIDLLEDWRLRNKIVDGSGNLLVPAPQKSRNTRKTAAVLGKTTLKEIRHDMARLDLPSWVAPAPKHPGEAKRGKFTADQWRSFCLINLPVTLNRLWGSEPEGSRRRQMLDNFMHLVTAVKLATMRSVTPARISAYAFHMHAYLDGLLKLYPGTTITPYQHLALHFQEFLVQFGPVHAWRCFPFERYNYLLQNINTNSKMGELETTLLFTFCKAQSLKALLDPNSANVPQELNSLLANWKAVLESDIRGTGQGDKFHFDDFFRFEGESDTNSSLSEAQVIPAEWFQLLKRWASARMPHLEPSTLPRFCVLKKNIKRLGETFQTVHASPRDSKIFFRSQGEISAGTIQGLFSYELGHNQSKIFFVVKPLDPLPDRFTLLDPYRQFPEVAGRLYLSTSGSPIILGSEDVLYHSAQVKVDIPGIPTSCIHALPLDRA